MSDSGGLFGRLIFARGSWVACSLLLASSLLAGCNGTGTGSGGTNAAANASSGASASTSTATSTTTSSASSTGTSTTSTAAQSASSSPTVADKNIALTWTAPTTNTNGSALTNLAGYTVYYGSSPTALNQSVNVADAGATQFIVRGLAPGTWYFAVAAYTNNGLQSSYSKVVSETIS